MKKYIVSFCLVTCLLIMIGSSSAKASANIPFIIVALTDSVPAKKNDETIKEVPRSHKQEKPVALIPVAIKPVVVKPKIIIKPIIKVH